MAAVPRGPLLRTPAAQMAALKQRARLLPALRAPQEVLSAAAIWPLSPVMPLATAHLPRSALRKPAAAFGRLALTVTFLPLAFLPLQ